MDSFGSQFTQMGPVTIRSLEDPAIFLGLIIIKNCNSKNLKIFCVVEIKQIYYILDFNKKKISWISKCHIVPS